MMTMVRIADGICFCFCFFRRHVTQEVVEINFGFEWNSGMFLEQEHIF
jgi:hypothetical protein